ncbi:MAG TPA: hypothetical protein DD713_07940 [Nitrospiraceae bacterium]|nr:hypothetical protein [Nitrospiraceae bacterium]
MPHAGLMDERSMEPEEWLLLRSKLHIRGGKRRLRSGKIAAGIVTIYDAITAAMEWYIISPDRKKRLKIRDGEDLNNDRTLYRILVRSKIIDGSFDYDAFNRVVERALHEEMPDYDYAQLLKGIEDVMTQLGVMPFDENKLPPEDPSTF